MVLWPVFQVGLLGDDWAFWSIAQGKPGALAFLEVSGARTRPLGTALVVALLGGLGDSPELLGALRVLHHAANAALVVLVAARVFAMGALASRAAGLLFLCWASHAELFWYSSIFDVAAATFVLLALLAARRPTLGRATLLGAFSLAAYLTKESSWVLPGLLLVAAFVRREGAPPTRRAVTVQLVSVALLGAVLVLRAVWAGGLASDMGAAVRKGADAQTIAANSIKLLFRSFVPGWVDAQELVPALKSLAKPIAAALGSLLVLLCLVPRSRRWLVRSARAPGTLSVLAYLLCLAPVATLSVSVADTQNTRYLYLPLAFLACALAAGAARTRGCTTRRVIWGVVAAVALFQGVSLHGLGWRWVQATEFLGHYRVALGTLARENPSAARFHLAGIPDTYRGAYVARNASTPLLRAAAMPAPRVVTELVSVTLHEGAAVPWLRLCTGPGGPVLYASRGVSLLHPELGRGVNPVPLPPWTLEAVEPRFGATAEVRLRLHESLAPGTVAAVYDGAGFAPLHRGPIAARAP